MCIFGGGGGGATAQSRPTPVPLAATDNSEAVRTGNLEARIRRRRAGAAANILTGPTGIPASPKMGIAG